MKAKSILLIGVASFILPVFSPLFPQTEMADSLKILLKTAQSDTDRIFAMDELTWEYLYSDIDSARKYAREALSLSEKSGFETWKATTHHSMGTFYFQTGEYDSAVAHFEIAKSLYEKSGLLDKAASSYNGLGNVYLQMSFYKKSLEYYLQGLKYSDSTGNSKKSALITGNIGLIYYYLKNNEQSLAYYLRSLSIAHELKDSAGIAASYTNLGNLYKNLDSIPRALEYHLKALEIFQRMNFLSRMGESYNNLGMMYTDLGDYSMALEYYRKSVDVNEKMNSDDGLCATYNNIGQVYRLTKNHGQAIESFMKGLALAEKMNARDRMMNLYGNLYEVYGSLKKFDKAYEYLLLYSEIKDSILGSENSRQMAEMQTVYETDKKQKEIELQSLQLGKQEAEINKQKIFTFSFAGGIFLTLCLAFFIFRNYREKKKANIEIEKRNVRLENANSEITHQKLIIEEKNKEMVDSINYARRIQRALIASDDLLKKNLPEYFVLFKPKDIVSGDFYWARLVERSNGLDSVSGNESLFFLCIADCTGHGVPGAFMSLLNISLLKEAVVEKKICQPDLVLNEVRKEIITALNPDGKEDGKDGMDCVLCAFDFASMKLEVACANNPLWLIREKEIIEIKPDKQPVGQFWGARPFSLQSIQLRKGDTVYCSSDGYADQFGGPKGKKFKYSQLEKLLVSIQEKSMKEQMEILGKTMDEWKGTLEQIDDICIIGVRV